MARDRRIIRERHFTGRTPCADPFAIDAPGPAGSINASVADMALQLKANLGGGSLSGKRILSEAFMQELQPNGVFTADRN